MGIVWHDAAVVWISVRALRSQLEGAGVSDQVSRFIGSIVLRRAKTGKWQVVKRGQSWASGSIPIPVDSSNSSISSAMGGPNNTQVHSTCD